MAYFTPNGIIKIGRVPFDNSYAHTMTFSNATEQANYFSSVCTQALERNTYTYVRMNNAIRVAENAEKLYTYNYCMYKNANYGNKWFYAFIVGCNYVNENCTELLLELDVMQTWYFDYTLTEGFVEREHVNDDTIGKHLNPEPEMPFSSVVANRWDTSDIFENWYTVIQTNATPSLTGLTNVGATGGIYQRVFNGCAMFGFSDVQAWGNNSAAMFLENLSDGGGGDSITGMFMFPVELAPDRGNRAWTNQSFEYRDKAFNTNSQPKSISRRVSRPTSLGGGYVPHNNKLFTYPYCYCQVDDNNGHYVKYQYEFWTPYQEGSNLYEFHIEANLDASATCMVIPQKYNGIENNTSEMFTFPISVHCSWPYSTYNTWLAQNGVQAAVSVAKDIALFATPAGKTISTAVKAGGGFMRYKGTYNKAGEKIRSGYDRKIVEPTITTHTSGGDNPHGQINNLANIASDIADIARASTIPDTARGSSAGNTLYAYKYMRFNMDNVVIREEFAKIIDGYLDMYGYQVDSLKVPNRTGRRYWNYVKMLNSSHRGNVPADDMAQINGIYNAGITFWHTPEVGNYSLDNSIARVKMNDEVNPLPDENLGGE